MHRQINRKKLFRSTPPERNGWNNWNILRELKPLRTVSAAYELPGYREVVRAFYDDGVGSSIKNLQLCTHSRILVCLQLFLSLCALFLLCVRCANALNLYISILIFRQLYLIPLACIVTSALTISCSEEGSGRRPGTDDEYIEIY